MHPSTHLNAHRHTHTHRIDTSVCQMLMHVHFIGTCVQADTDGFVYISRYVDMWWKYQQTHTHTHILLLKESIVLIFPVRSWAWDWFKETSICDVSTYLMNPLRSMDALVHYTAWLYWLDCFYGVLSLWGSVLGHIHVGVSMCVSSCVDTFVLMCTFHVCCKFQGTQNIY